MKKPLENYRDIDAFKIYVSDSGLLCAKKELISIEVKSPDGVIDETTIGTDVVTVTDRDGTSLLINRAQVVSGQGTKALTVRYTVEAQQSHYFTPGNFPGLTRNFISCVSMRANVHWRL